MWVLKLKVSAMNLIGNISVEEQVDLIGYPLSYYKEKNKLFITLAGFGMGEEKNKKALMNRLKNHKSVIHFEQNGDFIIIVVEQPLHSEPFYNPRLIRPKPDFVSKEGYSIWEIASWKREDLLPLIESAKKYRGGEILKFKEEKLKEVSFTSILPDLTGKQKRVLELAVSEGYYNHPRKTNVHKLAKLMKISYSTFQEHLRKAEGKVIPILSRRI